MAGTLRVTSETYLPHGLGGTESPQIHIDLEPGNTILFGKKVFAELLRSRGGHTR